ncbi:LamG domain-containing protein [Bowmanella denitrificans]|uniref:LamG domain-containing protein n=1 Tax=Bowmanella denitrificans TaxID=366582 RepID=UPI000C9A6456|nr:LamG domain-containing protein [Bowmanella denitrificans]
MKNLKSALFFGILILLSSEVSAKIIAQYPMEGNFVDIGPYGFNGVVAWGNSSLTSDRHGEFKAMQFYKTTIRVDGFRNYNFGNELTVSFWMKRSSIKNHYGRDSYMGLINNGMGNQTFDIRMGREAGGSFLFAKSTWQNGSTSSSSTNDITIGKWHHVAVVLKDGSSKLYVDGRFIRESSTNPGDLLTYNRPVIFGANANGKDHENLNGALDDIIFFDRALSEEAIISIANDTYSEAYNISLSPTVPNPVVPSAGGQIEYNLTFNNESTNTSSDFKVWKIITTKDGIDYPVSNLLDINVLPGSSYVAQSEVIEVPSWLPAGQHVFRWYVSDPAKEGGNILSAKFTFTKQP